MHDAPLGFDPADVPATVRIAQDKRSITLDWADGSAAALAVHTLRAACRCAWCSSARIAGDPPHAATDTALLEVRPLGRHAVHLAFSDGHRKGVFPWSYLRALARGASAPLPESIA